MAGRFGGLSVPLRRAARKFNRWLAVSAAKSLGLPPQRVGAHRAAFIRAHLDPDPLPHLLPLALLMLAQVARVAGQSCHCQPHTGLNFSRRLLRHFPQSEIMRRRDVFLPRCSSAAVIATRIAASESAAPRAAPSATRRS